MNEQQYIRCLYSCHQCGLHEQVVEVPARGKEGVVAWMRDTCIQIIALDHAVRSPWCRADQLDYLKIPITGCEKVGGAPVQ